uniref:Uncharacterized protein n=1 Tax=viral metagenome TaxID=1070528 RepID=A0A6M3M352_9ZZZZ
MKYTLRYRITIPQHRGLSAFMDMFRYSRDWIEEVESRKVFILRHNLVHRQRSRKFFHSQIERRWESFGAEVEVLGEVRATELDKDYRYKEGVVPIIEGQTRYDIESLRDEPV